MSDYSMDSADTVGETYDGDLVWLDLSAMDPAALAGAGGAIVYYRMLARNAANSAWLRWTATGSPDWTGAGAGESILAGSAVILGT
jgi:hypothetical protein